MGEVWLAEDEVLARDVAVKFALRSAGHAAARERFATESKAIARLRHPNVLTVHHAGEVDGRAFVVTELLSGASLDRLPRPVEPAEVVRIGAGLARGLAYAHRAGILHRDI